MKTIKILCVCILTLSLLVTCFASCGKKGVGDETAASSEEVKTTEIITETTEIVTDENGETVTEENGTVVTEIVTEKQYVPVSEKSGEKGKSTTSAATTKKSAEPAGTTKSSGGGNGVVLGDNNKKNNGWY